MNPLALRLAARSWVADARPAIEVRVASTRGSVPREAGARMLVADDEVLGSIGGGHLELAAIADANAMLADDEPQGFEKTIALGPSLGQCCGGTLVLAFRRLDAQALAAWPEPAPRFTLQLYGAGHVGRAVAALLDGVACRVQWIDSRDDEFPPEAPASPHIERICVDAVEAEVALAPPGAFYLVMTHEHDLDLRITEAILKRGDAGFCGLIGSATKRARFVRRFEQRGLSCAGLTCPIGLAGIDGKEPEVIALSVVAQLLQTAGVMGDTTGDAALSFTVPSRS